MGFRVATVATCNLNQWAMDFQGNFERIKESITQARSKGATFRVGPELEIPGYGCEDHFCEQDTVTHSWEVVKALMEEGFTDGIVVEVGMPVLYKGVRYNCRVFLLNKRVLLIRPKLCMADDGNYRESRYFTTWKKPYELFSDYQVPDFITEVSEGQKFTSFGTAVLVFNDTVIGSEICEEIFTPDSFHIKLAFSGAEIISNGSGSHHQLRKLNTRLDYILNATTKAGGVYLYSNQLGCDGGRLYFDGCACVALNGQILAQGEQFSMKQVEVVTATIDLDQVTSFRSSVSSLQQQASNSKQLPQVFVDFNLCDNDAKLEFKLTKAINTRVYKPEEEIAYGPACWLWDYLRRSGATGFLLPLSGGADSSSVAAIVGCMCQLVIKHIEEGNQQVLQDAVRIGQYSEGSTPDDAQELANRVLISVYMGTDNSSVETRTRAKNLSQQIGSHHMDVNIQVLVKGLWVFFGSITGKTPKFRADGGSNAENLALQNIQARLRMVLAFMLAQLMPWVRNRSGFLLVLGSANVDECLRGYLTKYDCSSADINPIGGISKGDLKSFLKWASQALNYPELSSVVEAPPTAELEPIKQGIEPQTDEVDMGMSYEELGMYGRLRKIAMCGPVSMFMRLVVEWREKLSPAVVAEKVKYFFKYYSINRHKATVLTPSYHAENYSPDDNRFDHRQFLYNFRWPWQFQKIDELVDKMSSQE